MRKLRLLTAPVVACVLLGATLGVPVAGASSPPAQISLDSTVKIHPLLQLGAQTDPNKVVRVIIQQVRPPSALSQLLGGLLSTDEQFTVIPALVTSVKQSSIASLAQDPNVRYISPDGPVQVVPGLPIVSPLLGTVLGLLSPPRAPVGSTSATHNTQSIDPSHLSTTYPFDTGATAAWSGSGGPAATGAGVGVAVLDTGVDLNHPDLSGHVLGVNVNQSANGPSDGYGHGSHVAGIIGGQDAAGQYVGIAPRATVISVKVADDNGAALESDVLRGLQWVDQNKNSYHIRAINLSVSTSVPQSYATSPIDAAVEKLWYEGVATVAAAGNLGTDQDAVWYAPGNDPLAITVGCLDENQTTAPTDDSLCPISSRGVTEDGFAKPDLVAPGRKIVAPLAAGVNGQSSGLAVAYPDRITADGHHIRLSGTSMATPMVTGTIALLLQRHPNLTPDQLKQILVGSASAYPGQPDSAGTLNISRALTASDSPPPARLQVPVPVGGAAPPAGSNTLVWDGARWGSAYWDGARWGSAYWDGARWGAAEWDGARWGSAYWDGARWGSAYWDGARWGSSIWD